jgi:NAD(P)-dependent dehydrogenase (short-subunit alcohol dehydrogenase family)
MERSIGQVLEWTAAGVGAALLGRVLWRRMRRFDFAGRTVLVTGGSRGLGLEVARQLAGRGARLALCARDAEELDCARHDLWQHGAWAETVVCDVTRRDQVVAMVERLTREWGGVDVVVNNAGVIQSAPMEEMTLDDYEEAMRTHFYGPLFVTEAVLPQMRRRGAGRVVNVASIGGLVSVPHLLPYCASKFALVGYSLGLRGELAKDGVVVTTICPGLMRTGSPRNAFFKGRNEAEHTWFKLASSLPVFSMNAELAAEQVVRACEDGDALVVLGTPHKVAAKVNALFPGLTADVMGLVNRLLPGPGGIGTRRAYGHESQTAVSESWLTRLTQRAAVRNNET